METIGTPSTKDGKNNLIDDKRNGSEGGANQNNTDDVFDVAIVGGGYAGLSAALLLGRYLRPTVIFDVMKQRKSHIHGYLGFENSPVEEVLQKGWDDVLLYKSVKRVNERVDKVERDSNNNLFLITTSTATKDIEGAGAEAEPEGDDIGYTKRKAKARFLVIATGIHHQNPDIKNFEEFLGNGIWHCPHCDGFEATDKKLVILASDNKNNQAIDYAKVFLGWTKDITLFFHHHNDDKSASSASSFTSASSSCEPSGVPKSPLLTDDQRQEALTLGINAVENDAIVEIVADPIKNAMKGILSKNNKFFEANVLFYHLGIVIQNELAKQLGCEFDEGYVKVNEKQETTVPDVYAAGDIDTDRHYAVLASASGALAAISIYERILKDAIKITKKENGN
jgi:thioredoxin reductase